MMTLVGIEPRDGYVTISFGSALAGTAIGRFVEVNFLNVGQTWPLFVFIFVHFSTQ